MKHYKIVLWLLVVLMVSLACSTSLGQANPAPVVEPSENTKLDFPTPVVATNTPVPQTESPMYFERLDDGSTRVSNSELHYRLVFDSFWQVIPMDAQLQEELLNAADEQLGDEFQQLLDISKQQTGMQFIAMDKDLTLSVDQLSLSNISLVYVEEPTVSMYDLNYILGENVEALGTLLPSAVISDANVRTNAKGLDFAWIVMTQPEANFGYPVKQAMAMFKLDAGIITITCSTHETMYPTVEQFFLMVLDSFELVN